MSSLIGKSFNFFVTHETLGLVKNERVFYILNVAIAAFVATGIFYFNREHGRFEDQSLMLVSLKNAWLLLSFCIFIFLFFWGGVKRAGFFLLFMIFSWNRKNIFLIVLNLVCFLLEVFIFFRMENYVNGGMRLSTEIMSGVACVYLIFLILKHFYFKIMCAGQ